MSESAELARLRKRSRSWKCRSTWRRRFRSGRVVHDSRLKCWSFRRLVGAVSEMDHEGECKPTLLVCRNNLGGIKIWTHSRARDEVVGICAPAQRCPA